MTIEISSVSERRILSIRGVAWSCRWFVRKCVRTARRPPFQVALALTVIAVVVTSDSFLRSYKYYSKIIDARLASGYLTSRPGLYAAPRTIRAGQGFSQDELIAVLRRAGYTETAASDVWSGSFVRQDGAIEIRPRRSEEHTSELQSQSNLVCRLLLEKKK